MSDKGDTTTYKPEHAEKWSGQRTLILSYDPLDQILGQMH